jgi:5-(carboxyamino)imidazole ribonucleotide synthase
VIGVLGAGQLGRMLALAGIPMGESFTFLHPQESACVRGLGEVIVAPYDDRARLEELARRAEVVTYEFESVPAEPVRWLSSRVQVYPPPRALEVGQDRLAEKTFFEELGIPTAKFAKVDDQKSLEDAVHRLGFPAFLKTRRGGYDGKGQARLEKAADLAGAFASLGAVPAILESHVTFERELSILAVRGKNGAICTYPLVENHHRAGILRVSHAPARLPAASAAVLEHKARSYAERVTAKLDYVGVLAIELFQAGDELLANEMAPRVHNSGHYSIEGAQTSQFENHLRAIRGLPLGDTRAVGPSAMVNLIGGIPASPEILAVPGVHLHLYGKEPKPGRKVGHATIRATSADELAARLVDVERIVRSVEA